MSDDTFDHNEKKTLLRLARQAIETYLKEGENKTFYTDNSKFIKKKGVFVTLHKHGELRGCIGYPLPIKILYEAVIDNAVSAATRDPRFPALTLKELDEIDIEISILSVPKKVSSVDDVVIGRDGIIITSGFHRGLLLPQVPVEQGWDLKQYISFGCMKAGLPKDEWEREVQIETFQGEVFGEKESE